MSYAPRAVHWSSGARTHHLGHRRRHRHDDTRTDVGRVPADADDVAGVVSGAKGPEAGVWVIAETRDLGTPFVRIVVTDDQGRYLDSRPPAANYDVWVRGYGLVDSPKVKAKPGQQLALKAVPAPNPRAAARVLPGRLLVLDAESAAKERVPRHRPDRATASTPALTDAGRVPAESEERRRAWRAISWAVQARDAFPRSLRRLRRHRWPPGSGVCSRVRPASR